MRILQPRRDFSALPGSVGVFYDAPRHRHMSLSLRAASTVFLVLLLMLAGCDKNPLTTVDPRGNAPVVTSFQITPAAIRLDTITVSSGLYPVRFVASTTIMDPDGLDKIASVKASVISPDGTLLQSTALHDDGVSPDQASGDGVYSGFVTLNLTLSEVGSYQVVFTAVDIGQREGTSAIQIVNIFHRASPPWISGVVVPDSVLIPSEGRTLVILKATVGDSSGVGDITEVRLTVTGSSTPTVLQMIDQHNIADLNAIEGELFADTLQVDNTSAARNFTLRFQAIDRAGDTSATISHSLVTYR